MRGPLGQPRTGAFAAQALVHGGCGPADHPNLGALVVDEHSRPTEDGDPVHLDSRSVGIDRFARVGCVLELAKDRHSIDKNVDSAGDDQRKPSEHRRCVDVCCAVDEL